MVINEKLSESLLNELVRFDEAATIQERAYILRGLIREKTIHSVKNNDYFNSGITKTFDLINEAAEPEIQLLAISLIERIAFVVKSKRKELHKIIDETINSTIPNLLLLKEPTDRFYVATSLSRRKEEWVVEYAAKIAVEETADKVRQVAISIIFKNASELQDVFYRLSPPLKELLPATEAPGNSAGKRLKRIIAVIRPELVNFIGPAGNEVGEHLNSMIQFSFRGVGKPEDSKIQEDVADEILGLLFDLLRTQLYVITDEKTYTCLNQIMKWHDKSYWSLFIKKSKNSKLISKVLSDSILLLAKQNITDSELFEQLSNMVGGKEEAQKYTSQIADKNPNLQANVREWLKRGARERKTKILGYFEESNEFSSDSMIALTLLEAQKFADIISDTSDDLVTELKIFESQLGENVETILHVSKKLSDNINDIAKKRNLSLKYATGEKVEYSQISHELITGHQEGIRWVKIIRPLVERESLSGNKEIIIKAIVERINS
jgi:hypothetical protein